MRLAEGSAERARAHANRSACHLMRVKHKSEIITPFISQQQHSSCSSEARTALSLLENENVEDSTLNELRQQLQTRLRECESKANGQTNERTKQPSKRQQLHLGTNSTLKSVSAAVEVRTVEVSDRGLYAKG